MIVGAGSLSFDLLKAMTERLPVVIFPQRLKTQPQPIANDDVPAQSLDVKDTAGNESQIVEIGGYRRRDLWRSVCQTTEVATAAEGKGLSAADLVYALLNTKQFLFIQ